MEFPAGCIDGENLQDHTLPGEIPIPEGDMDAAPLSDEEIEPPDPKYHPTKQQLVDLKIADGNSGQPTPGDFAGID